MSDPKTNPIYITLTPEQEQYHARIRSEMKIVQKNIKKQMKEGNYEMGNPVYFDLSPTSAPQSLVYSSKDKK
jgi:hypothetical protein